MRESTTPTAWPAASPILAALETSLRDGSNLLVVGPARAGKTSIAKHFVKTNAPNAVLVDAPPEANERRLYVSILESLGLVHAATSTSSDLLAQVIAGLKSRQIQILLIDEIQGIFNGPTSRVSDCMGSLVALGSSSQIPFVLLSDDSGLSAIHASPVLLANFPIVTLP